MDNTTINLQDVSIEITGVQAGATASTYADGKVIGSKIKLPGACRQDTGYCALQNIVVQELTTQKSKLEFVFFNADPSATTFTDGVLLTINDADLVKLVGRTIIDVGKYESYVDNAAAVVSNIGQIMRSAGGSDLWMVVLSRGAPTYVVSGLSYILSFFKDEA